MTDVTVVIGAGGIGQAIARRISSGRHILVANHTQTSADEAAAVLSGAGFEVTAMQADVSDRAAVQAVAARASALGPIKALVQAAGVSPRRRRRSTLSCASTCTAPPSCSRSSAGSWHRAARAW